MKKVVKKFATLFYFLVFALTLNNSAIFAQTSATRYREHHDFDAAIAVGDGSFSASLSWSHLHGIGKKKQRLKVGYGLRLTSFVAANQYYITAPAKFTSTTQSLGTIFSETIQENIETITTATALTYSFNLAIYIQYTLSQKFDIGCNIDALGVSFGPSKRFNVISNVYDAGQEPIQEGSPTKLNLLLTSDNDIGSLNSEFFVRYKITPRISLRGGYAFIFSEYRTNNSLSFDNGRIVNDRYRYKAALAFLGVTFRPFLSGN
jgi:hypothetical protein